ncbi:MAG: TerB family tellurite resistance protein [Myxococcales bacterium]
MAVLDKLMSKWKSDPDFKSLNEDQNQAVVDALMAMIFSDSKLEPVEAKAFDHQVQQLPWRWAQDERAREKVIAAAREKVDALSDTAAAEAFVQTVAQRLTAQGVREKVYKMCLAIAHADRQTHVNESRMLTRLEKAFGIDEARADALSAEVKRG